MHHLRYWILCAALLPAMASAEERFKLGVISTLSGEFARYGDLQRSGVLGAGLSNVDFVFEDERCLPAAAVSAFRKLVSVDKVNAIIGPACGSSQEALAGLLAREKVPVMISNTGSRTLHKTSGGWMVSPAYTIEDESEFNAEEIFKRGHKRIAIAFYENSFSRSHEAAFRARFKGEILGTHAFVTMDQSAIKPLALTLKRLAPDAVYVPDVTPFLLGLASEAKTLGMTAPFFGTYATQMPGVTEREGAAAAKISYSYPKVTGDVIEAYAKKAVTELHAILTECKGAPACVHAAFSDRSRFSADGVSQSSVSFELRTFAPGGSIRAG